MAGPDAFARNLFATGRHLEAALARMRMRSFTKNPKKTGVFGLPRRTFGQVTKAAHAAYPGVA